MVDEELIGKMTDVLGISRDEVVAAQWGDNGPGWVILQLESAEAVLALEKPSTDKTKLDLGVVGLYRAGGECALEVRAFFADGSGAILEDPVTGSLNASIAQWLLATGTLTAPYTASQGTAMGRRGRVHIDQDDDGTIWVGGVATASITGTIEI